MQSNKKILFLCTFALLSFLITACEREKEMEFPLTGGIPQSEIVFMPDANPVQLQPITEESTTLGFINTDGSNRLEFSFIVSGGTDRASRVTSYESRYVYRPRWSKSGSELFFSVADLPPNMRLIDASGKMHGQTCTDIDGRGALAFDLQGNVFVGISKNALVYEDYKDLADTALIARYDLKSCQIVAVFSVPVPFDSLRGEIQEANNGLLVAAFYNFDAQLDSILLYNQTTGEVQTFPGYHPSLTEDGALLAYYNRGGALVIRDMQTGAERELLQLFPANDDWPPRFMSMPGWSPDRQWLVYNTPEGEIYKINIETGENIYLTYGWAPDWRK